MPTLLQMKDGKLWYPQSGIIFEPQSQDAWRTGIRLGVLGIGNFMTALCYLSPNIHIRHLSHASPATGGTFGLDYNPIAHWQVPEVSFAGITQNSDKLRGSAGSYCCSLNAASAFADLPACPLIVHIDLDYFINDFNGNPCNSGYVPDKSLRTQARNRVDEMFSVLSHLRSRIVSWVVAASPGFCSAHHWDWLCDIIAENIQSIASEDE